MLFLTSLTKQEARRTARVCLLQKQSVRSVSEIASESLEKILWEIFVLKSFLLSISSEANGF